MVDILTPVQRSAQMARIRGADTKIELLVRKALHARGFRYRLGGAGLPGRPDIVLSKHRAVVFVHGCFWHGHDCHLFRLPKTRAEFWQAKISSNQKRDRRVELELDMLKWRVFIVWECALRGKSVQERTVVLDKLSSDILLTYSQIRAPTLLKPKKDCDEPG